MDAGARRCAGNQQKDVLIAIQQLRDEAVAKDIIKTDDKIKVVSSGDNVIIESAIPRPSTSRSTSPRCFTCRIMPPQPISYYAIRTPLLLPVRRLLGRRGDRRLLGAAVDWDDWGVWGGNWGGDVDRFDCNNCFNNMTSTARSTRTTSTGRTSTAPRSISTETRLANIDRTKIKHGIKSDGANRSATRPTNGRQERASHRVRPHGQANDVRKTAVTGTRGRAGSGRRRAAAGSGQSAGAGNGGAGSRPARRRRPAPEAWPMSVRQAESRRPADNRAEEAERRRQPEPRQDRSSTLQSRPAERRRRISRRGPAAAAAVMRWRRRRCAAAAAAAAADVAAAAMWDGDQGDDDNVYQEFPACGLAIAVAALLAVQESVDVGAGTGRRSCRQPIDLSSLVAADEPPTFDEPAAAVEAFKAALAGDDLAPLARLLGLDAEKLKADEATYRPSRISGRRPPSGRSSRICPTGSSSGWVPSFGRSRFRS